MSVLLRNTDCRLFLFLKKRWFYTTAGVSEAGIYIMIAYHHML